MGGPNSINLSNPIHGSGFNPRQEGAAQAPNLKELVLTIDDFRQFASGKYNAGAASGERIGAHRAWERLESKDIDPSEAAAIRLAFAFALEDAGVSGAKMAAACKRLGLEADFSFSESDTTVYTSLSPKEVGDIIQQSLGEPAGQGRVEPPKGKKPDFIINEDDIINDKHNIINEDNIINDKHNIIDEDDVIIDRPSVIKKDDVKIDVKDSSLNEAQRKRVAKQNYDTIVELMMAHYGEIHGFTRDEVEEIIQRVEDWEEKLAECEPDDDARRLCDLNDDLKEFLMDSKIQEGIDEVAANKI